jgi:hypothetical protein
MHPYNWILHIEHAPVKPVSFPQVDKTHPHPSSPLVTRVIALDGLSPELSYISRARFAKARVAEKGGVFCGGLKIRRLFGRRQAVDYRCTCCDAVPAPEFLRALGFIVHGCAYGDYALDLISRSPVSNGQSR